MIYKPGTFNPKLVKIGPLCLSTAHCALLIGAALAAEEGRATPYKYARRALAAWLSEDQWKRHSFKLVRVEHWRPWARFLIKHELAALEVVDRPDSTFDARLIPTHQGKLIAATLLFSFPQPLTGKQYAAFIEARRMAGRKWA